MRKLATIMIIAILATLPAAAGEWWIPASAHADGAEGSVWRTDFTGRNFGTTDDTVTVTLLPRGEDNSALSTTATVDIPAGATVQISDVVMELFSFEGAAAFKLEADGTELALTSRTYNQSLTGTYGQSIPAVATSAALAASTQALLMGLSGTEGRRTNVGWVSLEGTPTTVSIMLMDAAGNDLMQVTSDEQPYGHTQINSIIATAGVDAAYARIQSTGRVVPYASVVAGGSNDPIYVAARSNLEWSTDLLFPAVVHAPGNNDTSWRSDMWLLNTGSNPAAATLELWLQNQENPAPATFDLELAAGEQVELVDVVQTAFGLDNAQGALVVRGDQLLIGTSRTYNTADEGTYGQFIAGQPFASLGTVGETVLLPGVEQNEAFRSNGGFVSTSAGSTVELALRGGDGTVLGTATLDLGVNQQVQRSMTSLFGVSDLSGASLEVTLASADGDGAVVAAYLSMVDNITGDPTYSPAARGFGVEPDLEGITNTVSSVTSALTGAVEQSGPTGIAPPKDVLDCVAVTYTGDTIPPGTSPEGKCWQVGIVWDNCVLELPAWGLTLTRDGSAEADACVIDGYPSTLTMDILTTLDNSNTGEYYALTQLADLALAFTFEGSRTTSAHIEGGISVTLNQDTVTAWGDLTWANALTGLEQFPVGTLVLTFPYDYLGRTYQVEVTATYDATEWAYVQVRVGYWYTSFYLNLVTGETIPA